MRALVRWLVAAVAAVLAPPEVDCPVVLDGQTQCRPAQCRPAPPAATR